MSVSRQCCLTFLVISAIGLTAGRVSRGDEGPFARPSQDAIAKAEEKAREVYKGDLTKANKPSEKAALARELMTAADGAGQDDASRLALLTMTRDLAVDAEDSRLAMAAVAAMVSRFQPDGPTDPKEQIERGNTTWKEADAALADKRLRLQVQAAEWYLRAQPAATGFDKITIEKRLAELGETKAPPDEKPLPTVKIPEGWVRIVNRANGLAIGVKNGSLAPGTVADQYSRARGYQQRWQIEPSQAPGYHGFYTIRNQKSGQYLAIKDRSMERGAPACQMPGRQHVMFWQFEEAGDGFWRIINRHSGQCLEAPSSGLSAVIMQGPFRNGELMQEWRLEPVESGK